jgi:alginate export protein
LRKRSTVTETSPERRLSRWLLTAGAALAALETPSAGACTVDAPVAQAPAAQPAATGVAPATAPPATAPPAATGQPAPAAQPAAPARPKREFLFTGSWRTRQEVWDWFGRGDEGRYTFTGSLLRFGGTYATPRHDLSLELAQPTLLNLPKDASLPPPSGQLGHGASYRDANGGQELSLFVKQAFWRVKGLGGKSNSARLGRFEFVDGTETVPKEPSLAWLKRERIAHRLLGTFGFTHVGRSFDGGQFVHNTPDLNLTFFGGMPTEGVFDLDGGATLDDIKVGYAAATRPLTGKRFQGEGRLFGLYYLDERDGVVKTDNRPLPVRMADQEEVSIGTVGGHFLGLWDTGCGKVDGTLWTAGQFGDFGGLSHGAFALAAEAGFQPRGMRWSPWLRAGFFHASGDGDPADGDHGTFFPVLLTPRIYARFPFYTLANLNDAFAQVVLKPHPKWTVRSDVHALWLADPNDLWYIGGGAFQGPSFGYAGRPSNGKQSLATLVDLSADYQVRKYTTLSAYFGYAFGGGVIDRIYDGEDGLYGYLEFTQRW